ncbi:MAG TPA: malto-oligosyltrehalose trehalohydrolase [Pseudolabrys sp.]
MSGVRHFGPFVTDAGVTFRLWAPAARTASLLFKGDTIRMPQRDGWYELHIAEARAGDHYKFNIDDEFDIPDPASHFQPEDLNGPSEIIDENYAWQARDWKGRPWHEAVFLETHVGTFTREGTYRAMIVKLDHLVETGITALELMPLADFPGRWNWGYDGVLLFAPDSSYGRPEYLKALIDAAHQRGLMVFLDVVYNHFGPEGNYLGRIAPAFFSKEQTPWGGAINYEVPQVRRYAIDNALHWLRDYRFDGLRLDAVHAIVTPGEVSVLKELSETVGAFAAETGRLIHLVLENDDNRAGLLAPDRNPPDGRYRAQWNDDYHHAWHVLLTGEDAGYYEDYKAAGRHVPRALAEGFAYQGEPSLHRDGQKRGEPSNQLGPAAFVNFLQNHDQIGNRPLGERLTAIVRPEVLEAALSVLLLQPSPPMLFMGEEWGATEPFPFFCDFKGDLADAVRNGRKKEFAAAYAAHGGEIPDPLAHHTFDAAKIDWDACKKPEHAKRLLLTRELLAARGTFVMPLLPAMNGAGDVTFANGVLSAQWRAGKQSLQLLANLSDASKPQPKGLSWGAPIWRGTPPRELPPWSVFAAVGG